MYQTCVDSLVDLFLAGFNTCVLVAGETGSGKSSTIGGESGSRPGIVNMVIDNIFKKLAEGVFCCNNNTCTLQTFATESVEFFVSSNPYLLTVPCELFQIISFFVFSKANFNPVDG